MQSLHQSIPMALYDLILAGTTGFKARKKSNVELNFFRILAFYCRGIPTEDR